MNIKLFVILVLVAAGLTSASPAYAQVSILEGTDLPNVTTTDDPIGQLGELLGSDTSQIQEPTTTATNYVSRLINETSKVLGENGNLFNLMNVVVNTCTDNAKSENWDVLQLCLEYEQMKNDYLKDFVRNSQNLSNQIMFGG